MLAAPSSTSSARPAPMSARPAATRRPCTCPRVTADLNRPETLPAALDGVSRVFLYAQPEGIDGFVRAAAAGVEHVVFLSSSSTVTGPGASDPIAQRHLVVEQALKNSGVAWTFVRPGAFATNALRWAGSIRAEGVVRMPYPRTQTAPIHEADIAAVAVAALTGSALHGAAPVLTGPDALTQEEQVAQIGAALGRDLRVEELTPEQARAVMAGSMPPPFVDTMLRMWAAIDGVSATISDSVERITGHPARSFGQWARDHEADFRA